MGYDMSDYPVTVDNFTREISLPVFYDLTNEMRTRVLKAVVESVEKVRND
jgi:dTDP-4-amino-4,6-dideoxygalactose transaminase